MKTFGRNNLAMSSFLLVCLAMDHKICCIIVCLQRNMNLLCLDSVILHSEQIISTSRNALLQRPLYAGGFVASLKFRALGMRQTPKSAIFQSLDTIIDSHYVLQVYELNGFAYLNTQDMNQNADHIQFMRYPPPLVALIRLLQPEIIFDYQHRCILTRFFSVAYIVHKRKSISEEKRKNLQIFAFSVNSSFC